MDSWISASGVTVLVPSAQVPTLSLPLAFIAYSVGVPSSVGRSARFSAVHNCTPDTGFDGRASSDVSHTAGSGSLDFC